MTSFELNPKPFLFKARTIYPDGLPIFGIYFRTISAFGLASHFYVRNLNCIQLLSRGVLNVEASERRSTVRTKIPKNPDPRPTGPNPYPPPYPLFKSLLFNVQIPAQDEHTSLLIREFMRKNSFASSGNRTQTN